MPLISTTILNTSVMLLLTRLVILDQINQHLIPFKYVVPEDIPLGITAYTAEFKIIIPEGTDEGDYFYAG